MDSAGVFAIIKAVGDESALRDSGREDLRRLSDLVKGSSDTTPVDTPRMWLQGLFVRIGQAVVAIGEEAYRTMDFSGRLMVALGRIALHPRRLRLTPLFAVMEEAGINAVPIVMVMTFFIGAVIALVGANLLTTLGVSVFTVQLVGVAVLREFGVVIAAILLAGRSASAFAAQLGSMRMNQEVDAMQVMGVDRFEALVVPRVLAALLMTPLLTFCADIGGMLGGMIVSWAMIDIDPTFFIQRTLETVDIDHFWIGMSKAPFLALVISAAGCRHGLLVGGDTESLGRHVTAAVVQSIFLIIMFDAIFALIFMVLDL
ncbi:MAG: ABC transporter permease [Sphingobium sp.]|uniref:MlaE family ABC transporter permease n=1 Tax=Sphingobium sp. TaxID=1912891 RepID=UPI0029A4E6A9|nr:ABC transporter permease [Sphingobium sp.]MDX3910713.1 ABC transporter permease [Sphingobium sp.]